LHKYVNDAGEEVEIQEGSKEAAQWLGHRESKKESESGITAQQKVPEPEVASIPNQADSSAQDPKPPPEPFLSRKDREVMAQGRLYCVR